jgi:hypothetical protein
MRRRHGMALAVTIGVVALIAILAVATLSLGGRLLQGSTLAIRDARLDAAVAFGLASATDEWRARNIGRLAVGASLAFTPTVPGVPASLVVTVTRVAPEIFWIASEAAAEGGAGRRESLILRRRVPDAQALLADDSTDVASLGFISIDSLAASADLQLGAGSVLESPSGVIHVAGDAAVSGTGQGILIVEGRLAITGPLTFTGVVIARGGISVGTGGVSITGLIRAFGSPAIDGSVGFTESAVSVQDVLSQSLTPRPVIGRRWMELH